MNFEQLMRTGWVKSSEHKSVEDQLRERLLIAENRIVSLENQIRYLRDGKTVLAPILKKTKRISISSATRHRVYDTGNGCCFYCRHRIPFDEFTVDHQVPVVKGGSNSINNLVAACAPCNTAKGDRMPTSEELERANVLRKEFNPHGVKPANVFPISTSDSFASIGREIEAKILNERG